MDRNDLINIVVTVFMKQKKQLHMGSRVVLQRGIKWDFKRPVQPITEASETSNSTDQQRACCLCERRTKDSCHTDTSKNIDA